MKILLNISLSLLALAALTASTAFAGNYNWKEKVTYGNDPTKSYRGGSRSCATRPYVASRWTYSYQPTPFETRQAYSDESALPASFKVGDTIVAAANVPLKVGDRVVATVPQGQRITVSSVEGSWIGTTIKQDGTTISGWVLANDLAGTLIPYVTARPAWSSGGCR